MVKNVTFVSFRGDPPLVGSAWPEITTFTLQNRKERGRPHAHLFTSHTKKWSYWRVESAPTRAYT